MLKTAKSESKGSALHLAYGARSVWDFHRVKLDPYVWSADEQNLSARTKAQVYEQAGRRFPDAVTLYLVGDCTGHYWNNESPVDLIVYCPSDFLSTYRREAQVISGQVLLPSAHPIFFWPISTDQTAELISDHFGPIYDIFSGAWVGQHDTDQYELIRPSTLLRRINWNIWKTKQTLVAEFEDDVIASAFSMMRPEDRHSLLQSMEERILILEGRIRDRLRPEAKDVWKFADDFENYLHDNGDPSSFLAQHPVLPETLAKSILYKFRYHQLFEELSKADADLTEQEMQRTAAMKSVTSEVLSRTGSAVQQLPAQRGEPSMIEKGWSCVVVTGSEKGLRRLGRRLRFIGYNLARTSASRGVIDNVLEADMNDLQDAFEETGCTIDNVHGEFFFAEPSPEPAPHLHMAAPAVQQGKWYYIDNPEKNADYRFLLYRGVRTTTEGKTHAVELLAPHGGMPTAFTYASLEDLRPMSLRPATTEDFEELDLIPPEFGALVKASAAPRTAAAANLRRLR